MRKRRSINYRRIWIDHFGKIPKDENGFSYEIHHIDGNPENNDISNLQCLSIQEHFDIHFKQHDFYACGLIASKMKMTEEDILLLSNKIAESNRSRPNPMMYEENRQKVSAALKGKYVGEKHHSYGKKRPEHSEYMKSIGFGKNKTKEHKENHRLSWIKSTENNPIRAKYWYIERMGMVFKIKNLKNFCREHSINYRSFYDGREVNGYRLIK